MPHDSKRIYTQGDYGVSTDDVASVLGVASHDVGTLCTSASINRWAIYKPISFRSLTSPTLEERKSKNMGLAVIGIDALKDTGIGVAKVSVEEAEKIIREWDYDRPLGGANSPYRLGDFNGYDHESVACDSDWGNSEIAKPSDINELGILVSNFSFRLNEESASNIGSANSNFMPLSYIVPNVNNWYLGLAIYIPSQEGWLYITGTKSLSEATSSTIASVFPTVKTNQWLRDLLKDLSEVTYIPCILVNPQTKKIEEQAQRTYISMSSGQVYCMPSGAKSHKIHFNVAIKNSYKQIRFNGTTVSGYILSDAYYINLGWENLKMLYLIKGYQLSGTGRTYGGWFIASVSMYNASYGFVTRQIIVIYATTNVGSNILSLESAPPESLSVSEYLYCKKVTELNPNGNTHYEQYGYTLNSGTISNSEKVSVTTNGGTFSFYGYASGEVQVGLTIECVR